MATATPEELPDGGRSSAGDERERTMAHDVRRLSDRELRDKAQRLQMLCEGPVPAVCLPDRGEKLRLMLQAVLDERNRRRHVMATATPENNLPGGESRVGDDEAGPGTAAREVMRDRVRQMSDRELREVAQRWKPRNSLPAGASLPDGGEKMRLLLQAIRDEMSNRRRRQQHGTNGATRRAPVSRDGGDRRSELHVAQQRHGPVNEATTTALLERRQWQSSGEVNAGGKRAREAPRQSSDSEQALWGQVQRLQELFAGPDGCRRLRLFLETCFREVNNRERRHEHACTSKKVPMVVDGDDRRSELHVAQHRHGAVNEATTTALPERRQSSGEVNAGGKRAREAPRQSPDSEQALWGQVQRLQELFAGPDGCRMLRLFLETCFREVNNRKRRHEHACTSKKAPMVVVENASSGGAKRRRGFANETTDTGSPEEEPQPASGGEEARERVEAEVRHLSDQALWERAQRCQEALAASISAGLPGGGVPRLWLDLGACLRELSDRHHHQDAHPHGGSGEARAAM